VHEVFFFGTLPHIFIPHGLSMGQHIEEWVEGIFLVRGGHDERFYRHTNEGLLELFSGIHRVVKIAILLKCYLYRMNKFNTSILLLGGILLFVSGSAQTPGETGSISEVSKLTGPRFGFTYVGDGSTSQVLNRVHEMDSLDYNEFGTGLPFTYTTQYGWQWETRFADSGGPIVGLVEWVAFVGGMEKGMFLPSFSSLVGVRGQGGFEFATGPNLSASGLGFVFAAGYNIRKGDFNMPINISIVPDKQGPKDSAIGDILDANDFFDTIKERNTGVRITVSVGFNLTSD
jgi:hypothetical protein